MRHNRGLASKLILASILAVFLAGLGAHVAAAQTVPLITKEELKPGIGSPNVVIIDVRTGKDWNASEKKIKGAVREDPDKVEVWAKKYKPSQDIVVYCA